ncbi:MAG TPA: cysteine--tRNA ligase [Candidatus Magasanikbacteria bacterium]|nr:MAG: cysteine--tRNA ligase [Candidatus Magasanikbacteria bacterium RIFOXYC2_FULL_39_8]HAT03206.1 cysteine--tRNA ligase [Candidatus Magasanikbacteria bacterium]
MLTLYNTLTRKKEEFNPLQAHTAGLYTCGPTVYNYAHIGNLRTYVFEDILKRVLQYNGYTVNHVMNITDVGHLTSDADEGEDKMEKGAKREGKTAWEIAEFYTQAFKQNLKDLHILEPNIWCKATDHIEEQINLVQKLTDKGFTYETSDGIYFDTTKLADYGKLANLQNQELKAGARVDLGEKRNAHDFALWKWSERSERHPEGDQPKSKRQMEWPAPFGAGQGQTRMGFPGWHIECSAMSAKYLGQPFDIHCGGIDHVPVHHTNEIAQSEAAYDKPLANYWMHGEFLLVNEGKMAKSENNFITLETLKEKGISPLAYRYFLLQTHYRKQLNFSWEALEASQTALKKLQQQVESLPDHKKQDSWFKDKFNEWINDDLNIPNALAWIWQAIKEKDITKETLLDFDKVLGLNLDAKEETIVIPTEVQNILDARLKARTEKNWTESDRLRDEIKKLNFDVEDTKEGQKINKL